MTSMTMARVAGTLVLAGLACAVLVGDQGNLTQPATSTIDRIRAHDRGTAVWWTGNAGWLVKHDELLIGFDLDLSLPNKVQPPPVSADQLASELDIVFVSHHHGDHCNVPTLRALAAGNRTTFVLPSTCQRRMPDRAIAAGRLVVPTPLQPFSVKGVEVAPIHAIHGNQDFTVLTREPDFIEKMRANVGYVVTLGGRRFLHPGDSVLTEEHLTLEDIDVLFVSPTVHNMYVDRSLILIERLAPAYVFPQHFGTFRETDDNRFWTRGYPDELQQRLPTHLRPRYHKLQQGETFTLAPAR